MICAEFAKFIKRAQKISKILTRRLMVMKKQKSLSTQMRSEIKKGLSVALRANANSSGCFVIYQPKAPKALDEFKGIK